MKRLSPVILIIFLLAAVGCKKKEVNIPDINFTGHWDGTFYTNSWLAGHFSDTIYTGFVTIIKNSDGSISVGENAPGYGSAYHLFPSGNTYYSYGQVYATGSHAGATCRFDSSYHKLTYVSGSGGMGGWGVDSFFAIR